MAGPLIALVAALDRDHAIGRDNELPWHLPDDLRRFKALTGASPMSPILMGRRTAQSLGRALPGRRNLVLTRSGEVPHAGMVAVGGVGEALRLAGDADTLWVIGGGEVYALCLPLADRMHLTHVHATVEAADAWFPRFDPEDWDVVAREHHEPDSRHAHAFEYVDYRRRGLRDGGGAGARR